MTLDIPLPDEAATIELGEALARSLPDDPSGWLITLSGELGAGKTTLARALLHALGHTGPVPSPTYTLVEPYSLSFGTLYHVDLYRIGGADELEFLGWSDLREGLVLVEWPDRARALTGSADIAVELRYRGDARLACVRAPSERGARWLATAFTFRPGLKTN